MANQTDSPYHDSSSSILADSDHESVGEDELPGPPCHGTICRKHGRLWKLQVIEQTPIRVMATTHSNIFILICIAKGTHNLETNYELFWGSLLQSMPSKVCFRELAILKLQKMTTKISLDWANSKLDILHIKYDLKHL